MMKKLKNLRKKPMKPNKKPVKHKKSKTTKKDREYNELYETDKLPDKKQHKQNSSLIKKSPTYNREYEYTDYVDDYEDKIDDVQQSKVYKHSPSRMKKSPTYDREYENTDYVDEYDGKIENLQQPKDYKHSPSRMKKSPTYDREYEYTDYVDEYDGKIENLQQPKEYKHSPSRMKKGPTYDREYENTDYIDEYDGKIENLQQPKEYKHSPSRTKKSPNYRREYEYPDNYDKQGGYFEDLQQPKLFKHSPPRGKKSPNYNRKYEYTDYNDKYGGNIEDLSQPKLYKNSPSMMKKTSRYKREYEETDYDDEDGQYIYNYDKQIYDSDNPMLDYTTEDTSKYRRNPGRTREYYDRTESGSFDDSDSDCLTCNSRSEQRSDYTSEYPSEYQREYVPAPRYRNMHGQNVRKRKVVLSEIELERSPYHQKTKSRFGHRRPYHREYDEAFDYQESPYRNDYETNDRENYYRRIPQEVYVAGAPAGHKAFTKQHHKQEEPTSESRSEMELYDDEEVKEEDPTWRRQNQSRYQVFAANTGENQGVFQTQPNQKQRETLLSVTDYNNSVPMVALKNTTTTKSPNKSQSIVYLPVVIMDNDIKLPHSKVVNADSILQTLRRRDKAEKPLDTNMNVYLQMENGQGNIFQQTQRNGLQEPTIPESIQVYTAQSTHSIPTNKKPTMISKIASKIKSKSKSEYPVQKSYINVAPSRTNPIEQKGSKISIKSHGGSNTSIFSSRFEVDKRNSPKGRIRKKEIKDKKYKENKMKNKTEDIESLLLSVNYPTSADNQSQEPRTNTVISTKGELQKQNSNQQSTNQRQPTADNINAPTTNLSNQLTLDRHVPLLKQTTLDKNGVSKSTVIDVPSKQVNLERQTSIRKDSKIITIKDVRNGQYEESKNVFEQADAHPHTDDTETASHKKRGLGSSLFHKKDSKTKSNRTKDFTPKYDPYTFNPDEYTSPTASIVTLQGEKSKEGVRKPKKSRSGKILQPKKSNVEFSAKTEEFQFWKVLSFDSYAFTCVYQVMQYFLGLSIHGTMMEILRNAKQNE